MPRPRSLTADQIASAALAIIDREGADALSVRAVAAELGTGVMSLYRYFESREQLEGFVVDRIFGSVEAAVPPEAPWPVRARSLLETLRRSLDAHPSIVPMVLTHRFTSERAMPWAEALLQALADAGLAGEERTRAFRLLSSYAVGAIQTEHLGPLPRGDTPLAAERHLEDFPLLAENATHARRIDPSTEYSQGVETLLSALVPLRDGQPPA